MAEAEAWRCRLPLLLRSLLLSGRRALPDRFEVGPNLGRLLVEGHVVSVKDCVQSTLRVSSQGLELCGQVFLRCPVLGHEFEGLVVRGVRSETRNEDLRDLCARHDAV